MFDNNFISVLHLIEPVFKKKKYPNPELLSVLLVLEH